MTEETLKDLKMEGLFDLLLLSAQELLEAMETKDQLAIKAKKRQVELLLRVAAARKAEALNTTLLKNRK